MTNINVKILSDKNELLQIQRINSLKDKFSFVSKDGILFKNLYI